MAALIILLGISLIISGGFLIVFIINVNKGQFDDTYSPAQKILFEDKKPTTQKDKSQTQTI